MKHKFNSIHDYPLGKVLVGDVDLPFKASFGITVHGNGQVLRTVDPTVRFAFPGPNLSLPLAGRCAT